MVTLDKNVWIIKTIFIISGPLKVNKQKSQYKEPMQINTNS